MRSPQADKAKRARRKLRALARSRRADASQSTLNPLLANAIATARAAYALCARKTEDPNVAVAAENAAASLASSFAGHLAAPRLGDRLRLEWVAAMPNPEAGLLGECARVLGDAIALSDANLADRIRLASAEAYSLARAVSPEAGWRSAAASVAFLSFAR